jgi:lipoprotein-releasing system permease protein
VSLVSIISGISIFGITLGVAALVVVLSVMNGFFELVRDLLVSFNPHVRIVSAEGGGIRGSTDSLIAVVEEMEGVVSVIPFVEGKALIAHDGTSDVSKVVMVRGIDDSSVGGTRLAGQVTYGECDLARRNGRPGIVVGHDLASRLALFPGDDLQSTSRLALLSARGMERMLTQGLGFPPYSVFEVRGLYDQEAVFENNYVFVSLTEAQRLLRLGGEITGVDIRLDDIERAGAFKQALAENIDTSRFRAETWYDLQRSLYDVMRLEKWGASLILALVILVAAFNIVGSLTMVVIEKRRDLGVLQALGMSKRNIRQVFLLEGLLIAAIGSGIGLAVGLILTTLQERFEFVSLLRAESFIIDAYPVSVEPPDIAAVVGIVFVLCLLAATYPAVRASATQPAAAVRNE